MRSAFTVAIGCFLCIVFGESAAQKLKTSSLFPELPLGRWTKIHEQKPTDSVFFVRQTHGGSAFDTRRSQLILFGSDTHGKDWKNSPFVFDVTRLRWDRLYPEDDQSTYRVNLEGIPVAGPDGDHPWAMHTFGAVTYHEQLDRLIVSSHPNHMEPGRFTDAVAASWPRITQHPTWLLEIATGIWVPLDGESVSFFPYATAYDSDRGVIIGYKTSGIYELSGDPQKWKRVVKGGLLGYGNNAVYDSWHKALIAFGSYEKSNDVVVYEPRTRRHQIMPTPALRPPRDQSVPMAFHAGIGRTVTLVDRTSLIEDPTVRAEGKTETWLYDFGEDKWANIETATLPFASGMNYNMEYDPERNILFLVANATGEPTAVWALRF